MMNIIRLPVLTDNYIFLLHDINKNQVAVVDPAEAKPVLKEIERLKADLVAIFNTHHHLDHVGGNKELLEYYPHAVVYGGMQDKGRIPRQQIFLEEGDRVEFADRTAMIYFVPGHTSGHIAYYFSPEDEGGWGELFCGDTLFAGGCGRLFEGTPLDMVNSLTKFRNLPDSTRVWCAHEYTLSNLQFALSIDHDNIDLQKRFEQVSLDRSQNISTIPSSIELEKLTNPFLRWDNPKIKEAMGLDEPARVFGRLRGMKDNYKSN